MLVGITPKPLWKTKTFWFGVLAALLPVLEQVHSDVNIDPDWLLHVLGVVIIALRMITRRPAVLSSNPTKVYVEDSNG